MLSNSLWNKVYKGYDAETKKNAIKTLRKTGEYGKLLNYLQTVKKSKLKRLLYLLTEFIMTYMSQP